MLKKAPLCNGAFLFKEQMLIQLKFIIPLLFFLSIFIYTSAQPTGRLIPHLHSHNDYLKDEPLWEAIENGAHSIEIDVFPFSDELKIAHVPFALKYRDNLREFYINPLVRYIEKDSSFYKETPLILMIDIKDNKDSALAILQNIIQLHKPYFTYFTNDSVHNKPLQLLISGEGFTFDDVNDMDSIYLFLDGDMERCNTDFPQELIPTASANYKTYFKWKGKGEMPKDEEEELIELVKKNKACNKKLRFYNMPHNELVWKKFLDEGVYWINTDNSLRFANFYYRNAY